MNTYLPAARYSLIYVYAIHDADHEGYLKIGKAELDSRKSEHQLIPNCDELIAAAKVRIDQQTRTAMVQYDLLYAELAVRHLILADGTDIPQTFIDTDVHEVLKNSGIRPLVFRESGRDSEWYPVTLDVAKEAITAAKNYHVVLSDVEGAVSSQRKPEIRLRREQADNVAKTKNVFKTNNKMLWDCKMRYGKTITAYELIKQSGYKKVIVVTHRPAVGDSWESDHELMFGGTNHRFIDKSKQKADTFDSAIDSANDRMLSDLVNQNIPFLYFASIQDLRGSKRVGGKHKKNNGVFDMDWDLMIVDESHEGVQTDLGEAVIKNLVKENTKELYLSGTSYSLRKDFSDNVFTWTYVDEQKAKKEWAELHPNEKNPYADLPTMNILTFDLEESIENSYRYVTEDSAFNFREFFRTWTGDIKKDYYPIPVGKEKGDFVHEDAVWSFLNLISRKDDSTNYPFSTDDYREMFLHTFWLVPGVREAKALSRLLKIHPIFKEYGIVNVAGDGDEEEEYDIALAKVRKAIKEKEKTITISCGRLTTGVTVKEWTAVMMLTGSASTAVNSYMQAIFRVQSPGTINGKQKENCYVFDFAPDRALRVISEVHRLSVRGTGGEERQKTVMGEFLNFCPVIAVEGTVMRTYDVPELMRQIKRISVDSAINSGFDDNTIYLSDAGIDRNEYDLEILRKLSDVVSPKKKGQRQNSVLLNDTGMTEEEHRRVESAKKKKKEKKPLTEEEKAALEKLKEQKKQQGKLFDLLRAVSIRLPLLFYGADADITEIIHLKDFVRIVDDESWQEFMPKGLRKELFLEISKYYDEDVLVGAGLRIRKLAKAADEFPPTVRAAKIVEILSKFKNPDKETVLTPWRVVNMHLGDTLGGYNFYDETWTYELDEEPRFIDNGQVTADILLNENVKILEMNSKSGLYPLYMAISLYKFRLSGKEKDHSLEELQSIWAEVVSNNIFVLCMTKMARSITMRTLAGYTGMKINAIYLTKLIDRMNENMDRLCRKVTNPTTWNKEGERMKFDAVVGNPPYNLSGESVSDNPIYHLFMDASFSLSKKATLITPGRYLFKAGKTPKDWNERILNDPHFKIVWYKSDSMEVFPTVDIKGGVAVMYRDEEQDFGAIGNFTAYPELNSIKSKVEIKSDRSLAEIITNRGLYRYSPLAYQEQPEELEKTADPRIAPSSFERMPKLFTDEKPKDGNEYIQIFGNIKNERIYKWFRKDYVKLVDNLYKYKVLIPKASGSGAIGEILSTPLIAEPLIGFTETYISIGETDTLEEAKAILKYIKTKFVRAMLGILKVTQNNPRSTWLYVPLQDFTEESDIKWSGTIAEIDKQLYKKYGLSDKEINFIEERIKPMN